MYTNTQWHSQWESSLRGPVRMPARAGNWARRPIRNVFKRWKTRSGTAMNAGQVRHMVNNMKHGTSIGAGRGFEPSRRIFLQLCAGVAVTLGLPAEAGG